MWPSAGLTSEYCCARKHVQCVFRDTNVCFCSDSLRWQKEKKYWCRESECGLNLADASSKQTGVMWEEFTATLERAAPSRPFAFHLADSGVQGRQGRINFRSSASPSEELNRRGSALHLAEWGGTTRAGGQGRAGGHTHSTFTLPGPQFSPHLHPGRPFQGNSPHCCCSWAWLNLIQMLLLI